MPPRPGREVLHVDPPLPRFRRPHEARLLIQRHRLQVPGPRVQVDLPNALLPRPLDRPEQHCLPVPAAMKLGIGRQHPDVRAIALVGPRLQTAEGDDPAPHLRHEGPQRALLTDVARHLLRRCRVPAPVGPAIPGLLPKPGQPLRVIPPPRAQQISCAHRLTRHCPLPSRHSTIFASFLAPAPKARSRGLFDPTAPVSSALSSSDCSAVALPGGWV